MRYVQIDDQGIVIGHSNLLDVVDAPNMVMIPDDTDIPPFGYQYINGGFSPQPEPTEAELLGKELTSINAELRRIFDDEQFKSFLGEPAVELEVEPLSVLRSAPSRKDALMGRRTEIIQRLAEVN